MAKQSGLSWTTFTVEESDGTTARDIRNDITNFQMATPRGVQDVTGIDKAAHERILLLADLSYTLNLVYNPSAQKGHQVFRTVSSSDTQRTTVCGIGSESLTSQILYTDYALTRAADGSFTSSVPGVLADGTVPTWVTS
jgi:hypothetical protein